MKSILVILCTFLLLKCQLVFCQQKQETATGKLFIIGGGDRSAELIKTLVSTAQLNSKDYIVVLPMSGGEPDSSFHYIKIQLAQACNNIIANLNFTKDKIDDKRWIDSLKKAKLIFITGGQQTRFMESVSNTPVFEAIHFAYKHGATIAGTSAGAAVMPEFMITGSELTDTVYRATFRKVHPDNIEFTAGLGLIKSAIIDQHFIIRSRYNRLLSAIEKFPTYICIGIDEATAIIVNGKKVTVTGESQVVVLSNPKNLKVKDGLIKMDNLRFSIYTAGDTFNLK
ncbi:MAG: cyanophycinase [Chitinophagaceae bacterium]|nr:cyanophycinase [Chitinophagaceae bacterium]